MSQGVYTPDLRFELVKGQITSGTPDEGFVACSPGKRFCLEVTREQLEEIMYRVQDAKVTAGGLSYSMSSPTSGEDNTELSMDCDVLFDTGNPPAALVMVAANHDSYRGYVTMRYMGDPEDEGYGLPPMANVTSTTNIGAVYDVDESNGAYALRVREAVAERGMWERYGDNDPYYLSGVAPTVYEMIDPYFSNLEGLNSPCPFRTGLSLLSSGMYSPPADTNVIGTYVTSEGDWPTGEHEPTLGGISAYLFLEFPGQVAWVDLDESGNPFSPGNKLFVAISFRLTSSVDFPGYLPDSEIFITSLSETDYHGEYETTDKTLSIVLASGTVSCPLYVLPLGDYGDITTSYTLANVVITATKWWPYAKNSPAEPVWNAATGAEL
jgi:hypothetical protein